MQGLRTDGYGAENMRIEARGSPSFVSLGKSIQFEWVLVLVEDMSGGLVFKCRNGLSSKLCGPADELVAVWKRVNCET